MKKSMTLKEELVKYIFGPTQPTVALGEDGYIVYDFKTMYPEKLAIFIPIEIEQSGYSNVFPKSFESYFRKADSEIARLSRLTEINLESKFSGMGVEYIPGKTLNRQENNYVVFRFDELIDARSKMEVLCRTKFRNLSVSNRTVIDSVEPYFKSMAASLDGREYIYWIMPISKLFTSPNNALAGPVFSMAN